MKTKNRTKTFEEAKEIVENLGFKQETDYVKSAKNCLVRFKKDSYIALVYKKNKNLFLIDYLDTDDVKKKPKFGAKPGPKPAKDKKKKIVVFIEGSKIKKLGGDVMIRELFYETATEAASMIEENLKSIDSLFSKSHSKSHLEGGTKVVVK